MTRWIKAPTFRLITVLGFVLACAVFFLYMYSQSGGTVPGFSKQREYRVSAIVGDVDNMVPFTDVQIAGVNVGKVDSLTRVPGGVKLDIRLSDAARPLHKGATVQVSEKSLAGQTYLRLEDGTGAPYPHGTMLPRSAVKPSVQLRDVLASLDKPTREALGSTVRALGRGTQGSSRDISGLMSGLGHLGRNGSTALDAISAQTADLKALARELNTTVEALDTGHGQLVQVVEDANRLTGATAGQREAIAATMTRLPGVLDSARNATGTLRQVGTALTPVASNLKQAAPSLSAALQELPATTEDLRALLPSLDQTLRKAPATLKGVPTVADDATALLPPSGELLRDLNPALRYLRPYGRDIAQIFSNFGASFHHYAEDQGSYVYVQPVLGPYSVRPNPVPLDQGSRGLLRQSNPYPKAGGLLNPKVFDGEYPRIERDPK